MGLVDGEDSGRKHQERILQRLATSGRLDQDYFKKLPSVFEDLERTHAKTAALISALKPDIPSPSNDALVIEFQPGQTKPPNISRRTTFALSSRESDRHVEEIDDRFDLPISNARRTKMVRRRKRSTKRRLNPSRKTSSSSRRSSSKVPVISEIIENEGEREKYSYDILNELDAANAIHHDVADGLSSEAELTEAFVISKEDPSDPSMSPVDIPHPATYASRLNEFLSSFFEDEFGNDADTMLAVSQMTRKQTLEALNSKRQHFFTVIRALITRLNGTVAFLNDQFSNHSDHQVAVSEYDFYMLRSNIVDALQHMQKSAEFATGLRDQMGGVVERSKEKERTEERRLSMMELSAADSENKFSISRQDLLEYLSHQQFIKKKLLSRHLKVLRLARLDQARQSVFITAMKGDCQDAANEVFNAFNEQRIAELENRLRELNALPNDKRANNMPNPTSDRGRRLMSYVKSLEDSHKLHESELARANEQIDRLDNTVRHLKMAIRRQLSGELISMEVMAETMAENDQERDNATGQDSGEDKENDLRMRLNDSLTALDITRSDLEKEKRLRTHLEQQLQHLLNDKRSLSRSSSGTHQFQTDAVIKPSDNAVYSQTEFRETRPELNFEQSHHLKSVSVDAVNLSMSNSIGTSAMEDNISPRARNSSKTEPRPRPSSENSIDLKIEKSTSKTNFSTPKADNANYSMPFGTDGRLIYQDRAVQTDPIKFPYGEGNASNRKDRAEHSSITLQSFVTAGNESRKTIDVSTQTETTTTPSISTPRSQNRSADNSTPRLTPDNLANVHGTNLKDQSDGVKLTELTKNSPTTWSPSSSPRVDRNQRGIQLAPSNVLVPHVTHNNFDDDTTLQDLDGSIMSRYRRLLGRHFLAVCRLVMLNKKTSAHGWERSEPPNSPSAAYLSQPQIFHSAPNKSIIRSVKSLPLETDSSTSWATPEFKANSSPAALSLPSKLEMGNALLLPAPIDAYLNEDIHIENSNVQTLSASVMKAIAHDLAIANAVVDDTIMIGTTTIAGSSISESESNDDRLSIDTDSAIRHENGQASHSVTVAGDDDSAEHRLSLGNEYDQINPNSSSACNGDDFSPPDGSKPTMGWAAAAKALRRKRIATATASGASCTGSAAVMPADVKQLRRVLDEREKELEAIWKQVEELESINRSLEEMVADLQMQLRGERAPQVLTDLRADNVRLRKEKATLLRENQDLCDQIANSLENEGEKVAGLIADSSLADQELKKRISKMEKMLQWWRQRWERMKRSKAMDDGDIGIAGQSPSPSPSISNPASVPNANPVSVQSQAPKKPPTLAVVNPVIPEPKSLRFKNVINTFAPMRTPNARLAASTTPGPAPKLKVFLKKLQNRPSLSSSTSPINLPDLALDLLNRSQRSTSRSNLTDSGVFPDPIPFSRLSALLQGNQFRSSPRNTITK